MHCSNLHKAASTHSKKTRISNFVKLHPALINPSFTSLYVTVLSNQVICIYPMNAACGGSHWTGYNALTAEINLHVASKRGMSPFVRKLLASYILHVPTGKSCTLHKVSVSSSPNYKISAISENEVDLWSSWIVYWGYRTHFNLWNVLIIWTPDFNYLIHFKSWDEWIFELTSILVPSYELRVMVLLSSGWRATVESLSSVHGSLQWQS